MQPPYDTRLPPLLAGLKQEIEGYARDYGLDFYETIFEVIDAEDLNEIAAYGGFPTRYPHWSFGMAYEELKKGYDYGLSKIYEMVINNDPCYAYLMRSNHVVDQKLVMAHVYGHCLAPDTKVEVRGGVKLITDVVVGDEVLTHNGRYKQVTARARRWHEGQIQEITISGSNQKVRITGEHPVLVRRPSACVLAGRSTVPCRPICQIQHKCAAPRPYTLDRVEWVLAQDVREGDLVCFPRLQQHPADRVSAVEIPFDKVLHRQRLRGVRQIPVDVDLAALLGYFIAEGNAQPRGLVGFGFHLEEREYHEEITRLVDKVFHCRVGRDDSAVALATTIRFNCIEVARWLREVVGVSADTKRIPSFLFDHPDQDVTLAVLRGLFNGDGTYSTSPGRRSGSLSYSTISETLAYQVRHLSLRLGLKAALTARHRAGRRPTYEVIWTGQSAHALSGLLLGQDVIAGNRSFERSWLEDGYLFQPVRSVQTSPYTGDVYNFSVADDESYTLAAGFVVHNCDFFKNNAYFAHTSRKMMDEMANHGARIRSYAEKFGEDEVERFVDRCMSIDDLIDIHSVAIRRRDDVSRYDFTSEPDKQELPQATRFRSKDYMDEYINPLRLLKAEEDQRRKQQEQVARSFPEQPQRDVLLFLIENAPLKNWQRDILSIIRDEAYYFMPQGMTKTLNEGWACISSSDYVLTNAGIIPMGQLVQKRQPVLVCDGRDFRQVYDWAEFPQRQVVTITTKRGLRLCGSVNHRVLLPDGTWRRLDQLAIGDDVALARGTQLWAADEVLLSDQIVGTKDPAAIVQHLRWADNSARPHDAEPAQTAPVLVVGKNRLVTLPRLVDTRLAAFLGYLIGDGHISECKRTMGLTSGDEPQADHFATLARELFNVNPVKKWDKTKWRIRFSSASVQNYLKRLGLKTGFCARQKTIPDVILRSPRPVVVAFLRALYDCDGYAGTAGVILSTSSTEMSKIVQLVLLNLGILSSRRPHQDGCWHVQAQGLSAARFATEVGFGLKRKQEALRAYIDGHKWFRKEKDSDRIVSIEPGVADVYDISVEETHCYTAQGFINHNSYWHSTIMTQKALSPSELVDYADHHSGTMATSRTRLNPYKLGIELLRDIEMRWNTGRFGKEYEECDDLEKKRTWDKQLGLGRQKIFEVRRIHNDVTFIDTFLTPEFCVENNMFSFAWQEQAGQYFIESRDFAKIKQRLLFSLTNFGKPWIFVVDGNYRNRGELLLKHAHNGVDLKMDQATDTLANIQFLWGRPVHLATVVDGKPTTLSFDGSEHSTRSGGEGDDARKTAPGKTR